MIDAAPYVPGFGLEAALEQRRAGGLLRRQPAVAGRAGARLCLNGLDLVNFCSNDYLALSGDTRLVESWSEAARQYGVGAGAASLVSGRFEVHGELERALAEFCGRDRALLFPSGFQANLAVIPALAGRADRVLLDKLCHASLIDAARLSRGRFQRFRHNDPDSLGRLLAASVDGLALVGSESVFSMDGDTAPLADYARLCREQGACLYVDDAHGFGVLGASGRGGLDHMGLNQEQVPLMMATFGKALGVAGAFVAGEGTLIEALVQWARPYIYSTAMPPAQAATVLAALSLVRDEEWRRRRVFDLIRRFRDGARRRGLVAAESTTPIQPLILGDAAVAVQVSEALLERGFYVAAIRPPTVPAGTARLRITLTAAHSDEQVDGLLDALAETVPG